MNVNVWDVNEAVQDLIRAAQPFDIGRLANPKVALEEVLNG